MTEHSRLAGDFGHVADLETAFLEGFGRAAGRDDAPSEGDQRPCEVNDPGLVVHRQERDRFPCLFRHDELPSSSLVRCGIMAIPLVFLVAMTPGAYRF